MSGPNGEPHVAVGGAGGNEDEDEDGDSFGEEGAWGRPGAVPPAWAGPPGEAGWPGPRAWRCGWQGPDVPRCFAASAWERCPTPRVRPLRGGGEVRGCGDGGF